MISFGLQTKIVTLVAGDSLLRIIVRDSSDDSPFLLFMGGFTTAVIQHDDFFYLFDSHSRDMRGLSVAGSTYQYC